MEEGNEGHCPLGSSAVYFGYSPTFRRNISVPSCLSKCKPSCTPAEAGVKLRLSYVALRCWAFSEVHNVTTQKLGRFISPPP
jgi:hypothetical protein